MLVLLSKIKDYEAKIKGIEKGYFTTSGYNKFTNDILDTKITEKS